MADPVVVFRTGSQVEADVVRGLLEAHGISAVVSTARPGTAFPLAVSGWDIRVLVAEPDAAAARRLIESHREAVTAGRVVRFGVEFAPLEARLGYRFRDIGLLEQALTHRSRAHEDATGGVFDNESLEFLGDAVLGLLMADRLFREFPDYDEGRKSKLKAWLVSARTLARLGARLGLGDFVLLGRGEEQSGGRGKQAILADSYEAVIAAIYLDGGLDAARRFVEREFADLLAEARAHGDSFDLTADYKSALQEFLQGQGRSRPEYRVTGQTGPDHRKRFRVEVRLDGETLAAAEGRSKKEAAQRAARAALERLSQSR